MIEKEGRKTTSDNIKPPRADIKVVQSQISRPTVITKPLIGKGNSLLRDTNINRK